MRNPTLVILCLTLFSFELSTQTIWNGPDLSFSKPAFGNPNNAANQDRITDLVWITRANTMGIYNAKTESGYNIESPAGTEWAKGTTEDINALNFSSWQEAVNSNPPGSLNESYVLHLIEEDIYIDIEFTQWGQGQSGGGSFSYTRSTENTSSNLEINSSKEVVLSPNPATTEIFLRNVVPGKSYQVWSIDGRMLLKGQTVHSEERVDLQTLSAGKYIFRLEGNIVTQFDKL